MQPADDANLFAPMPRQELGILTRQVTPSVPVRVDYELTPLGHSLALLLMAVKDWAETHIEQVHEARERYDAANEAQAA